MSDWKLIDSDASTGIKSYGRTNANGEIEVRREQDVSGLLDQNKAMRNHNDGYSESREIRRVASIPPILIHKWRVEEGLDIYNPAHADRLMKKLNDPDYAYLRTADGRLGMSGDVFR